MEIRKSEFAFEQHLVRSLREQVRENFTLSVHVSSFLIGEINRNSRASEIFYRIE